VSALVSHDANSDRFISALLKAKSGEKSVIEETYLYLPGIPGGKEIATDLGVDYFAVPVEFGPAGAVKAYPVGALSDYEQKLLKIAVDEQIGVTKVSELGLQDSRLISGSSIVTFAAYNSILKL